MTTTINISKSAATGMCSGKCDYNISGYANGIQTISGLNGTNSIVFNCIANNLSCIFNNNTYNLNEINMYTPSIIYYNNNQTAGNIILQHTQTNSQQTLSVVLPIIINANSNQIVTDMISAVLSYAPSPGESTNNIQSFQLTDLLPAKAPYLFFEESNNYYICFDLTHPVGINDSLYQSMQTIIKPYPVMTTTSTIVLYMNPEGISKNKSDDEIYISCQPTDQSSEKSLVEMPSAYAKVASISKFKIPSFVKKYYIYIIITITFCIALYFLQRSIQYAGKNL